jgi:3-phosphoshikimate 1-carboxyvinyltransferase
VQSAGAAGAGDHGGADGGHGAGADDLGFEEMRRFLDDARVAKQYWPERLEIIGELPRTQTGKVQKFMLRERIRAMIEDEAR